MKIEVRTRSFSLTQGLHASVERRMELALDRYRDRIARVRVVLDDLNGPKGGEDKSCGIEVVLRDGRAVRATARGADAYVAIADAAHRVGRALARVLGRDQAIVLDLS